jgi:hypothetical protein
MPKNLIKSRGYEISVYTLVNNLTRQLLAGFFDSIAISTT